MRDRPNAFELLDIARETLVQDILPHIPSERRYQIYMVANAIANAEREFRAGDVPLQAELERLRQIYGDSVDPPVADRLEDLLLSFNRRLARDIRAGRLDDERKHTVQEHLIETAKARVTETNPKFLDVAPVLTSQSTD
ncbi:MAG: DUF6285 domain-containing protein [Gammaproteobacteria bacterium]|nr:DUF6285 domain-containing protein [Gammaproteobacteria bacterium]